MVDHEASRRGLVYCLVHNHKIRYVGITTRTPEERLRGHVNSAARGDHQYVSRWIRSVNLDVGIQIVAELDDTHLDAAEVAWIIYMRSIGCDLVNTARGGRRGGAGRTGTGVQASCAHCRRLLLGPKRVTAGCKCTVKRVVVNKPVMYPVSCVCHRREFPSATAIGRHLTPTSDASRKRYAEAQRRKEQLPMACDLCGKVVRGKGALTHHRDRGKCRYARRERQRRPRGYRNLLKNDVQQFKLVITSTTSGSCSSPGSDVETKEQVNGA